MDGGVGSGNGSGGGGESGAGKGTDPTFGTRGAGITVRRALELPGLRGGLPEILVGADLLDRTVRWVHAGEVPHIASLLKGVSCC